MNSKLKDLSDDQILEILRDRDSLISRVRLAFYSNCAKMEQACDQRKKPSVFDLRRMELDAAVEMAFILGVDLLKEIGS